MIDKDNKNLLKYSVNKVGETLLDVSRNILYGGRGMYRFEKRSNYLKSAMLGMTTLILPMFFQNQDIPKIPSNTLTDSKNIRRDYALSIQEMKKEAERFGYKE